MSRVREMLERELRWPVTNWQVRVTGAVLTSVNRQLEVQLLCDRPDLVADHVAAQCNYWRVRNVYSRSSPNRLDRLSEPGVLVDVEIDLHPGILTLELSMLIASEAA